MFFELLKDNNLSAAFELILTLYSDRIDSDIRILSPLCRHVISQNN